VSLVVARPTQIINSDFYQRQGEARYLRELPIKTSRGMITDRNGEPLAVSTPVASIWVNPQDLLRSPRAHPGAGPGGRHVGG
jgi:cell division protein FtsI (penicillin-binding protein 3)